MTTSFLLLATTVATAVTALACNSHAQGAMPMVGLGHTVQVVRGADRGYRIIVDAALSYVDRDDELVEVTGVYGTPGHSYALIAEASGGNACPSMYRAIALDGPKPMPSAQFGTCSDLPQVRVVAGSLIVGLPAVDGKATETFTIAGTRITKTVTATAYGNQGPPLTPSSDLAEAVNGKAINEAVKLRAVVQAIERVAGSAKAKTIIDYALGGPGTSFESRGTFVVAMACMAHDCGRNQARVAFDHSGKTWILLRTNGIVAFIGDPPFEVRRALQS